MSKIFKTTVAMLLVITVVAMAQEPARLAVAVAAIGDEPEGIKALKYISTELTKAISRSSKFEATERSDQIRELIYAEHADQRSGVMAKVMENISELGRQTGAQLLCIVESDEIAPGAYQLSAKFVDIEKTTIVQNMMGTTTSSLNGLPEMNLAVEKLKDEVFSSSKKNEKAVEPKVVYVEKPSSFSATERWGTWAVNVVIPGAGSIHFMDDFSGALTQWMLLGSGIPLFIAGMEDGKVASNKFTYIGAPLLVSGILFNAYRSAYYEKPYRNDFGSGERSAYLALNLALPGAGYFVTGAKDYSGNGTVALGSTALSGWAGYAFVAAGIYHNGIESHGDYSRACLVAGGILSSIHIIASIYHFTNYGKKHHADSNKNDGFNFAVLPTRNGNGVAYGLVYSKSF